MAYPVSRGGLKASVNTSHSNIRDWSLLWGGGRLQNGKIVGPKPIAPPPPKTG